MQTADVTTLPSDAHGEGFHSVVFFRPVFLQPRTERVNLPTYTHVVQYITQYNNDIIGIMILLNIPVRVYTYPVTVALVHNNKYDFFFFFVYLIISAAYSIIVTVITLRSQ